MGRSYLCQWGAEGFQGEVAPTRSRWKEQHVQIPGGTRSEWVLEVMASARRLQACEGE